MGLTSATGEPVLCICILAAKSLSVTDVKGFYYRAKFPYDSSKTMEENMGEGKTLPGLPVCKLRGKLIPGLMCMYPKGSISSKILTEALKYLYHLNIFERRQYGPTPFGLLEGHGSRLHLPFLEYINSSTPDEQRKWMFTFGTPYATDVWQVGDSCHQNGCWKMAMTVEKDSLLHSKHGHAFESTDFDRCGIVPLINQEW